MSEIMPVQSAYVTDIPAIMRVMDAAFDPAYGEAWTSAQVMTLFALPSARVATISVAGKVSGFYATRIAGPESELLLIAVHPEKRGLGLGHLLMDDWKSWAEIQGVEELFLEVRSDNPALTMYNAAGFSECGRRPGYYRGLGGVLRDAITMRYEF